MKSLPIRLGHVSLPVETADALPRDPGCQRCKLAAGAKTVCIEPVRLRGEPGTETLLVVGDFPGRREDEVGEPFVGQAGTLLRGALSKCWDGEVILDYAIHCPASELKDKRSAISACRGYLAHTIRSNTVHRIVCLGSEAASSVLGVALDPYDVRKGWALTSDGVPVFIVTNPFKALRNRFVRKWFEEDLAWACTTAVMKSARSVITCPVETEEDALHAVAQIERLQEPSFDAETFGVMHNMDFRVLTMAVGNLELVYVWDEAVLGPLLESPAVAPLRRWFAGGQPKAGQNVQFDIKAACLGLGVTPRNVTFDVRLGRKLLTSDASASLKNMQYLVGAGGSKSEADVHDQAATKAVARYRKDPDAVGAALALANMSQADLDATLAGLEAGHDIEAYVKAALPPDVRVRYCASDVATTDILRREFRLRIAAEPGLHMVQEEIVAGAVHAVAMMEMNGMAVDRDAAGLLSRAMSDKIDRTMAVIAQYSPPGFELNPNAGASVAELLFTVLGLKCTRRTAKTKAPCTDAETLGKLKHPCADAIVALKQASHFKKVYADGIVDFIRDDGRVHPHIMLDGTTTGRPSCKEPNMFNIPRPEDELAKLCRDMFIAGVDLDLGTDLVIVEIDQSQVEVRVAAILSGDEEMVAAFRSGMDFHLHTAKLIAPMVGIDPLLVTKAHPLRSKAKTIVFAFLYGKTDEGIAAELGIEVKEAAKLRAAILGKYKALAAWLQRMLRRGRLTGEIRTQWRGLDARVRPLWEIGYPEGDSKDSAENSTANTPIQGTAADFTNASLGHIQRWIEDDFVPAKLCLTVYDSIMLRCPRSAVPEVAANVTRICTQWHPLLAVDVKYGWSWGSLESWKP